MLDRRTMAAMLATAPFARPLPRLDVPDPHVQPLNTEGVVLFGISPDASVLVGRADRDRIVFLDAETRFPISESAVIPEIGITGETAVSWSPDGKRIAFGLEAWRLLRDSDIFIADAETGEVTNLTAEGHDKEAANLMTVPDVQIDISPVWLDDNTVLFARHGGFVREEPTCELSTISVSSGDVETFIELTQHGIRYVSSRIWRLSGGELVCAVDFINPDLRRGAIMITPDGEVAEIRPGELTTVTYISINDTHLITLDAQDLSWMYASLDNSIEPMPLWDHFEMPEGWRMISDPVLGPDPDSMFVVLRNDNDVYSAHLFSDGKHLQLGVLEGKYGYNTAHWADGYILIAGQESWLLSQRGPGF